MINIEKAIVDAYLEHSILDSRILNIEGMSSPKVRHLLNNIVRGSKNYLEVGSWKGSTLISAVYGNAGDIYAMDNFSEFGEQDDILRALNHNINDFLPNRTINFVNADFHKILSIPDFNPSNIEVYFYDGNHEEQSQYDALVCVESVLADEFILIIDDWNHPPAQTGTMRAIRDLSFTIHENYALPAKFNGDLEGWWNGLWIARISK